MGMNTEKHSLDDLQQLTNQWIKFEGVRCFNELTNMTLLMEEVGEKAWIMARTYDEQSFKENENDKDIGEEMTDILWLLICLANQTGVDLIKEFIVKYENRTQRDLLRHQNNEKLK